MAERGADRRFVLRVDLATMAVAANPPLPTIDGVRVAFAGYLDRGGEPGAPQARIASRYRRAGSSLSRDLLGQYCAVVIDGPARRVVLTQDSLGLRKLFYCIDSNALIVASDLDLILAVRRDYVLDPAYFANYIGSSWTDRSFTPFKDIHRLAYGWTIEIADGRLTRQRPWTPAVRNRAAAGGDPQEQLRTLLDEAVAAALPEAGIVFCELTGGLDSTSVYTTAIQSPAAVEAITYIAERGMSGDDELFAGEVIAQHPAPWRRIDMDLDDLVPSSFDGFVPEPHGILYARQFAAMERAIEDADARVLLTGSAGDVIFEFGGVTPAFLADHVAAGRYLRAIAACRDWARGRAGSRAWSHYFFELALPIARRHKHRMSVLDWQDAVRPAWISAPFAHAHGLDARVPVQQAPRVEEPGRQHLWESIYDLAAHENGPFYRGLTADVRHPLYHRPLVDFMLSLDYRERRGSTGDRRLQRSALADRLPEVVRTRRSKGSAQELRERHLMESRRWREAMTRSPRLVARGWVEPEAWAHEIAKVSVGVSRASANLMNAMQAELWLRALEETPLPAPISLDEC